MKNQFLALLLGFGALFIVACEEETPTPGPDTTNFQITINNDINLLAAQVFNTPSNSTSPGPIPVADVYYEVDFKAQPGSRLSS